MVAHSYYPLYNLHNPLQVYVLPVKQRVNSVDCGCHAIPCAVEFLCDDGDPLSNLDVDKMREHLAKCLESENLAPFPKS